MTRTYATICSGVEGCSLALEAAPPTKGAWRPVFFAEIAPFPSAVLAHRWPHVPNLGDISKIRFDNDKNEITNGADRVPFHGRLDLLAGGTPCQDFSVAGKRQGGVYGSGTRSSLCWEWLRLVAELRPRVVLWENVPGCLSTNGGRDFARLVAALDGLGYGCAWRILDCQHTRVDVWPMAIPQRRRRVWLVGCADADVAGAAEILFEPPGVLGHFVPRRKARAGAPGGFGGRAQGASGNDGLVYPTLTCATQQMTNEEIAGGGLVLEPAHCKISDVSATIVGGHESRITDQTNVVIGFAYKNSSASSPASARPNEAPTLLGTRHDASVMEQARVRRLTPEECERLMGYPEGHTKIPWRGKPAEQCPDGPRYEACGNGWAINCARWVLLGIDKYLKHCDKKQED